MEEFLKLVGVLLTTSCGLDPRHLYTDDFAPFLNNGDSFDFIVVGSGPSGAAVASRLAENPNWRVLLVEAGDYPTAASEIPGTSLGQVGTEVDWKYKFEPMENAGLGMVERRINMPRGKMLGGSSGINAMIYTRGLESDYDNWEKLGNPGWSWKNVEKYFKKLEKLEESDNEHYGKSGRVSLDLNDTPSGLPNRIMEAGKSFGQNIANNEGSIEGFYIVPSMIGDGRRCSSAKAYLSKSNIKQQNLYISLNTLVTKVVIRRQKATGIELLRNGKRLQITATREVILSAGSIGSPQILMLSGVGPKSHLNKLRIPVKKDLQVGENFQDHPVNMGFLVKINPTISPEMCSNAMNYCLYKNGSLSTTSNTNVIWSLNTMPIKDELSIHMHFAHDRQSKTLSFPFRSVNQTIVKSMEGLLDSHDVLSILIVLTKPESRGRILLKSKNPFDHPIIHGNYYTDQNNEDITAMVNSVEHIKKLLNSPTMKPLNPKIVYLDIPGCRDLDTNSRDYWICHFRHMTTTCFHPVGTCKMGPAEDKAAVVDSTLKVYGIQGLRVADASIMPVITNRNTQAPAYMIGEKAADLIKQDHGFIVAKSEQL